MTIESDTDLLTYVIADQVSIEAAQAISQALPDSTVAPLQLTPSLATLAEETYRTNRQFRMLIKKPGDAGRDTLYDFMHGWLAGWIKTADPKAYDVLPDTFKTVVLPDITTPDDGMRFTLTAGTGGDVLKGIIGFVEHMRNQQRTMPTTRTAQRRVELQVYDSILESLGRVVVEGDREKGPTKPYVKYIEDDAGEPTEQVMAYVHVASAASIQSVLAAKEGDSDGRSEFRWVRFQNGDLCLAVFPHGETYIGVENDAAFPG